MNVTTISISSGRTFNHPYEQYSNLRPSVTLTATLLDGEDLDDAVHALQAKAEKLVEEHKQQLLRELERLERMTQVQQKAYDLERAMKRAQVEYEELKRQNPEIFAALPAETESGDPLESAA